MPTQDFILGPVSRNTRKKKAIGKNSKGQKRARFTEENRYNAALELAIEEENDNAGYTQNSEKEDDEDQ